MAKFVSPGESIEGEKIWAHGRKILPAGPPFLDPISKKPRFCIEVKLLGGGIIRQPFASGRPRLSSTSHVALEDELWGNLLSGSSYKPFKADKVAVGGGRTGSHSGQGWMMVGDCSMRIVKDWLKQAELPQPESATPIQGQPKQRGITV